MPPIDEDESTTLTTTDLHRALRLAPEPPAAPVPHYIAPEIHSRRNNAFACGTLLTLVGTFIAAAAWFVDDLGGLVVGTGMAVVGAGVLAVGCNLGTMLLLAERLDALGADVQQFPVRMWKAEWRMNLKLRRVRSGVAEVRDEVEVVGAAVADDLAARRLGQQRRG